MRHGASYTAIALLLGCCKPVAPPLPATDHFSSSSTVTLDQECDAQNPSHTVGLLSCTPEAQPGYTLFAPIQSGTTYLIDTHGNKVHSWESNYPPGESAYLEPGGFLLRTAWWAGGSDRFTGGGAGGRIEQFDWDSNLVWDFEYADDQVRHHHDVERLPNGNLLLIAWEYVTRGQAEAWGRDPGLVSSYGMWADHIIEVDPAKDIVWEWHIVDHVVQDHDPVVENYGVPADNPQLMDINVLGGFGGLTDWNHINSVDYNAELDQILLSAHNQNEIWIIDHSTTTEEAAGHTGGTSGRGGDLLYRWGSPANHGAPGDQRLSGQHDAEWIPEGSPGAGNVLIFNNNLAVGESEVVEIVTPVQSDGSYATEADGSWGPAAPLWAYSDGPDLFSFFISGAQRLPNGNTLICEGDEGEFMEVNADGDLVWHYINPVTSTGPVTQGETMSGGGLVNAVFRADRYRPDDPGLQGRSLRPDGTVEQ
jgi:hypothetical protein